jgi:nitronate monooxygenase
VNDGVHAWGGITLHDIIHDRFARKAVDKGADGLDRRVGRRGRPCRHLSPFPLVQEIREWFDGPLLLSGSIATGRAVLAAQAMGADLAYIGSPFVATREANASEAYKQSIVDSRASDIVYSNLFTGIHGNYLRSSIEAAGMDPDNLPEGDVKTMNFESATGAKAWRDIWGSGQGIGAVKAVQGAGDYVDQLAAEYQQAKAELAAKAR